MAILHIRGKEKGRGEKRHQGIPLFIPLLLETWPGIRRKCKKTEDRKAIRKSDRRTFLSLTT
jgi:hypothetical protein